MTSTYLSTYTLTKRKCGPNIQAKSHEDAQRQADALPFPVIVLGKLVEEVSACDKIVEHYRERMN